MEQLVITLLRCIDSMANENEQDIKINSLEINQKTMAGSKKLYLSKAIWGSIASIII